MKINDLIKTDYTFEVKGISTDSREMKPGYIFIPIKGDSFEGIEFIDEAINNGCCCVLTDKELDEKRVPIIKIKNSYETLQTLLNKFYGDPSEDICLIGVTGTDGKTTVSTLCSYILNEIKSSYYIGTNGIHDFNGLIDVNTRFTTLTQSQNFEYLYKYKEEFHYVCLEASSEGLYKKRLDGLKFDYTIFTNLSHEHLNTHHTLRNYFLSKLELFKKTKDSGYIIVNNDDSYAKYFDKFNNVITYGIFMDADVKALNIRYYNSYTLIDLKYFDKFFYNIKINRCEQYNIYNILPCIIVAIKENINTNVLYECLENLPCVLGRLEKIPAKVKADVYIDFAHTPNGLKAVLNALKEKKKKRLLLIMGAAGNKDKTKRPLMGEIACSLADFVYFTSEDPRNEKVKDIINDLTKNVKSNNYIIIPNRKEAIKKAILDSTEGDIVLITGKGRENYFEANNIKYHYSDIECILGIN